MKRAIRFILPIIMIVLFLHVSTQYVHAKTFEALETTKGTVRCLNTKSFEFYIPVKSKVTIGFTNQSYGYAKIMVKNAYGACKFSKNCNLQYESKTYKVTLSKGVYKLLIKETDDWEFDYSVYVDFSPVKKHDVKKVYLNCAPKLYLTAKNTYYLWGDFSPYYASGKETWKSSNSKVAKVSSYGVVSTKTLGETKITYQKGKKKATTKVYVDSEELIIVKKWYRTLKKIAGNIKGFNSLKWSNSNRSVAKIENGKIVARSYGHTTLSTKKDGHKYIIEVYVKPPVTVSTSYIEKYSSATSTGIKFVNNTDKKIVYITLDIKQYNNAGTRLTSLYSYYYVNDDLKANDIYTWEFWTNEDTRKAKPVIKEVTFSDGTKWRP